ncbi:MAG: hypothetical protein M5R41_04130 [Bacteroidia bacterium]|nr:hypothetical protein [Bacteroidia bacterium]
MPYPQIIGHIDAPELEKHLHVVRRELGRAGLFDKPMRNADVSLLPFDPDHPWRCRTGDGNITIPEAAMSVLRDHFQRDILSLRHVLRHAYGHVYAETHREIIGTDAFAAVFGGHYFNGGAQRYDKEIHVSSFAAESPAEDFAEIFAEYLDRGGKLPRFLDFEIIRRKWNYIGALCE